VRLFCKRHQTLTLFTQAYQLHFSFVLLSLAFPHRQLLYRYGPASVTTTIGATLIAILPCRGRSSFFTRRTARRGGHAAWSPCASATCEYVNKLIYRPVINTVHSTVEQLYKMRAIWTGKSRTLNYQQSQKGQW
jgi:hypothetical protein